MKITSLPIRFILTGILAFVFPALAYATTVGGQDADHPFGSEEDLQYNCQYVESASLYRPCRRRYGEDGFDAIPSTGSFTRYNGQITNISDVQNLTEYRVAIEHSVTEGYFDLFRNRHFIPNLNISREEFIDILFDVLDVQVPSNTRTDCFADLRLVDRTNPRSTQIQRQKKVCYAHSKGWLDQNVRFMPKRHINKAAAAKILMSAYDFPGGFMNLSDNYFEDVERGAWYARFINAGRKHNIFPDKRRFDPGTLLTRKEASLWFYNLRRQLYNPVTPQDTAINDIKQYTESTLTQMINQSRAQYGKVQLKHDPKLYELALSHSQQMAQSSSLTHGNLSNYRSFLGHNYMALGENIAVYKIAGSDDISEMVERIHNGMMNEPPNQRNHRANILGETFAYTYFAVAAYEDKRDGRVWITEIFAKKRP